MRQFRTLGEKQGQKRGPDAQGQKRGVGSAGRRARRTSSDTAGGPYARTPGEKYPRLGKSPAALGNAATQVATK